MRSLKSHFPDHALTTLDTLLQQTKEARVFRRAQAVREVVAGHHINTVSAPFGRVLAGCGYCFGISPKRSERGQSAGHHHSKPVFKTLFTPLGMYLSAPSRSTPRSSTGILF